jgi:hypothetical protein
LRSGGDKRTEPARPVAAPQSTQTDIPEPTEDDAPGLLLLESPDMDNDEDGSSSLSSLPSDMEVDDTQH